MSQPYLRGEGWLDPDSRQDQRTSLRHCLKPLITSHVGAGQQRYWALTYREKYKNKHKHDHKRQRPIGASSLSHERCCFWASVRLTAAVILAVPVPEVVQCRPAAPPVRCPGISGSCLVSSSNPKPRVRLRKIPPRRASRRGLLLETETIENVACRCQLPTRVGTSIWAD